MASNRVQHGELMKLTRDVKTKNKGVIPCGAFVRYKSSRWDKVTVYAMTPASAKMVTIVVTWDDVDFAY
jgi:hypothetical protein